MKSIRYVIVILTLLLSFNAFTQSAAINNDIKLVLEESEWPVCIDPTDVSIASDAHESKVSWNNQSTQGNYYFEVGVFEDAKEYPSTVFETKTNFINLENSYFQNRENTTVKIRRICIDKQFNKYTSKWVEALSFAPCTPGSISGTSTICGNTLSPTIANATSASGGVGYIWQSRSGTCSAVCCASTSGWTTISGATSQDYIPGVLSQTMTYRRGYNCGSPATPSYSYSNCITITVTTPTITPGTISSNTSAICPGLTATITGTLASSTSGTIQYQWQSRPNASSAYTNITSATSQNYTTSALTASTQFRRLAKTSTCTTWSPSNEISININAAPTASISSTSNSVCLGSSMSMTASGGGSYSWSNGLGSASTVTVTPSSTTTYTVTVTGSNGCNATAQKTITVNSIPTASITASNNNNAVCLANSITLTAAGGGTYLWSAGLGTTSSISVTPASTTTYTVTVTAANSTCTSSSQITITVNPNPTPTITSSNGSNPVCAGTAVSMTASGGVSYVWSNGTTVAFNSVNPTYSMSYTVTVTGSNGCTAMGVKDITVNPLPTAQITGESNICPNQTKSLVASGGTSYEWSTGSSNATIQINNAGTYTVTVTNNNGCASSASKEVTLNSSCCQFGFENIVNTSPNIGSCPFTYKLYGSFSITNPIPGAKVKIKETNSNLFVEKTLVAGTYNYTFEINNIPYNGGSYTVEFTIDTYCGSVPPTTTYNHAFSAPSAPSISGPTTICENTTGTLSVINAPANSTYEWNTGATTQSIALVTPSTTYNVVVEYAVTVTSSSGCVTILNKSVNYIAKPEISFSNTQDICQGQNATISAITNVSPATYEWSNGMATPSIVINISAATTYFVTVTNANGCSNTNSVIITPIQCNCTIGTFASTPTATCSTQSNVYSLYGSVNINNPLSGSTVVVKDFPSNVSKIIDLTTGVSMYNFTLENIPVDQQPHVVKLIKSDCPNTVVQPYTAPTVCVNPACSITDIVLDNMTCNNNLYNVHGVVSISNYTAGQQYNVELIQGTTIVASQSMVYPNTTFDFNNLPTNGLFTICKVSNNTCMLQSNYTAPVNCNNTAGITLTNSACDPITNTHDVTCVVSISNPIAGYLLRWVHSSNLHGDITLTNDNTYQFTIAGIPSNGTNATVSINPIPGICPGFAEEYETPESCLPVNCQVNSLTAIPGSCNLNKFAISGTLKLISQASEIGSILTLTDSPSNITTTVVVTSSNSYNYSIIDIPADGLNHTVSVSGDCGSGSALYKAPASCSALPVYQCGQPYQVQSPTSSPALSSLNVGEIIYAAGLGVLVTTVSGGSGNFSGEGLLAHPFPGLPLKVSFSGITVNNLYQVTNGEIEGVRSQYAENFNTPQGTISFGGEICQEEEQENGADADEFDSVTGLNKRGFKRDSLFYPGGKKYDEQGYDFQGRHQDTGTPYDTYGCNMEGYDIEGYACSRDSLLNQKRDSLITIITTPPFLDNKINDLITKLNDSLLQFNCNAIRTTMNTNITALNYTPSDTIFIKGKDNIYFKDGMSNHFAEEPKILLDNSGREVNAALLEENHVKLYGCDKFRQKYTQILDGLNSVDKTKLTNYIKAEVKKLSKAKILELKEGSKFIEWVLSKVTDFMENGDGLGSIESSKKIKKYDINDDQSSAFYGLSSDGYMPTKKAAKGVEEAWLFNQGFKKIKGVSRGYYLDEIYNQRRLDLNPPTDFQLMPIPLIKDTLDASFRILIDNVKLSAAGAKLDAYFIYDDKNSSQRFVMEAEGLSWGAGGLIGDVSLKLLSTVEIKITNSAMLILNPSTSPTNGTYVTWDCKGYKKMQIDGGIELCPKLVVPLNPTTYEPIPNTNYRVDFIMSICKMNEIYFELNGNQAKPFAITGHEDMKWMVTKLVIDYSDQQSPKNVVMFSEYNSPEYDPIKGFSENWKGVYIGELSVRMSKSLGSSGSQPTTVGAQNIVIDNRGVSGKVFATNIVDIKKGSLGGWPFSLDTISIIALNSKLIGGGLCGKIQVPIFKKPMRYAAHMKPNNGFEFVVSPSASEEIDMMLATAKIDSNSTIRVKIVGGEVEAVAELYGVVKIGSLGGSSISINIPDVRFEQLKVSNKSPYFESGTWRIDGGFGAKIMGFELNVDEIRPIQEDEKSKAGIAFNVGLALPLNIKAGGGLEVMGRMEYDSEKRQKWVYETTKITAFKIDGKFSGGHVRGFIDKFDEGSGSGIYGKGFQGMVDLGLDKVGEFKAMALFGKSKHNGEDFKYFFVDASVKLTSGIPLGPIEINGFVGGVSYKMNTNHNGTALYSGSNPSVLPPLGQSFSGIQYTPDYDKALGLRAGGLFKFIKNEATFNGLISFDILFNATKEDGSGGGLAKFGLTGIAQLMSKKPVNGTSATVKGKKPDAIQSPLSINLRIEYDNNNNVLKGDLETFLNLGVFQGVGKDSLGSDNYKMVDAELYVDSKNWWFYFGTPSSPCGIRADLGIIKAELKAYLDIGTIVPNMPPLPANVTAIAGEVYQNQTLRTNGAGFTMGASFDVKAELNLGIASGSIAAGLGFDIMIRDFGNATCGVGGPQLGINGWYGMGQMWAYVEGSVTFLKINILKAGIAAVLQAQLPNPMFAQATVGIKIKTFLTGEFKKNMTIKFGSPCNIIENGVANPLGMKVIANIDPNDGGQGLPTDVRPAVTFAIPMEDPISMGSDKFDAKVESTICKSLKTGKVYDHKYIYNEDKTMLTIDPAEVFDGKDSIQFIIKVAVSKNGGAAIFEKDTVVFTTGGAYTTIPLSNIESSYPLNGMSNYYIKQNNSYKGFVQLKSSMPNIFYNIPEGHVQKLRLTSSTGTVTDIAYKYDGLDAKMTFSMDPDFLENNKIYKLQLIRIPSGEDGGNANPDQGIDINDEVNNLTLRKATGANDPLNNSSNNEVGSGTTTVLLEMYFRTSIFNTLEQKINTGVFNSSAGVIQFAQEGFDELEKEKLINTSYVKDLVIEDVIKTIYEQNFPLSINFYYETGAEESECDVFSPDSNYVENLASVDIIDPSLQLITNQQFSTSADAGKGKINNTILKKLATDVAAVKKSILDCRTNAVRKIKLPNEKTKTTYPSNYEMPQALHDIDALNFVPSANGLKIKFVYDIPGVGYIQTTYKNF